MRLIELVKEDDTGEFFLLCLVPLSEIIKPQAEKIFFDKIHDKLRDLRGSPKGSPREPIFYLDLTAPHEAGKYPLNQKYLTGMFALKRYLLGDTWQQVAKRFNLTKDQVRRLIYKILQNYYMEGWTRGSVVITTWLERRKGFNDKVFKGGIAKMERIPMSLSPSKQIKAMKIIAKLGYKIRKRKIHPVQNRYMAEFLEMIKETLLYQGIQANDTEVRELADLVHQLMRYYLVKGLKFDSFAL